MCYDLKFNKETLSRMKKINETFKMIKFNVIVLIVLVVSIVFLILYYIAFSHLNKFSFYLLIYSSLNILM